jgi:molecular chaperone GrpE
MAERDDDPRDDQPPEEGDADLFLDLDEDVSVDVDQLTREALAAVSSREEEAEVRSKELEPVGGQDATTDGAVSELQAELADLRDRSIRTLADFENYRRRAEREREDLKRYAIGDALRELLPVVDNLQRALAAGGTVDDLKTGVELTLRQFTDLLRQRGVVEVPALGAPFDPAVHEAVARVDDATVTVPTVVDELQRGYTLHGKLLRPALVRVAMPAERWEKGSS